MPSTTIPPKDHLPLFISLATCMHVFLQFSHFLLELGILFNFKHQKNAVPTNEKKPQPLPTKTTPSDGSGHAEHKIL